MKYCISLNQISILVLALCSLLFVGKTAEAEEDGFNMSFEGSYVWTLEEIRFQNDDKSSSMLIKSVTAEVKQDDENIELLSLQAKNISFEFASFKTSVRNITYDSKEETFRATTRFAFHLPSNKEENSRKCIISLVFVADNKGWRIQNGKIEVPKSKVKKLKVDKMKMRQKQKQK